MGPTAPDGTICYGDVNNVAINDGILELTVPGGQTAGGRTSGAELMFGENLTGGVFQMVAQIDGSVGTCQAIVSERCTTWCWG
jgi:hypothetical protein